MENEEKSIKKVENFSDSQENFVSLQKNMGGSNYDTEHNRGAEAADGSRAPGPPEGDGGVRRRAAADPDARAVQGLQGRPGETPS